MTFVKDINVGTKKKLSAEELKKASADIDKAWKEDSKPVKGVFKNLECPGGDLEFALRLYRGDPIRSYHFIDGETYTIPLGVAKHINRQCKYKKSKHLVDKDGNRMIGADKSIERYQFVSVDFM